MVACGWYVILSKHFCVISGSPAAVLLNQAYRRINAALRPCTSSAYMSKLKIFMAFATWYQFPLDHVDTILAFLEFMAQNGSSAPSLLNHVSALRHFFKLYDLSDLCLSHRKVHLLIKSVSINSPYSPRYKTNFTIPILLDLAKECDKFSPGHVYKAIFLVAYFAFLRLSNMAPPSSSSFDPSRHFTRGDVIFGPPGAHTIVKWAKAMQGSTKHQVVQIPSLPTSPLCPVRALKTVLSSPAPSSSPLFTSPPPSPSVPITAPMVTSTLARLLSSMGLNPSYYGFHAFRRSAVSWAADHNVPLQNLKAHGGWSSNAIHTYLNHTPKASSTVASTFQKILST